MQGRAGQGICVSSESFFCFYITIALSSIRDSIIESSEYPYLVCPLRHIPPPLNPLNLFPIKNPFDLLSYLIPKPFLPPTESPSSLLSSSSPPRLLLLTLSYSYFTTLSYSSPTHTTGNWDNEIRRWVGDGCPTFAVKSTDPKKIIRNFVQVNYETFFKLLYL